MIRKSICFLLFEHFYELEIYAIAIITITYIILKTYFSKHFLIELKIFYIYLEDTYITYNIIDTGPSSISFA